MVIDPKSGGLLSIKEAVKRGILSITGAPVVTGHHNGDAIETPMITSRKTRHSHQQFDEVIDSASPTNGTRNGHKNNSSKHVDIDARPRAKATARIKRDDLNSDLLHSNPEILADSAHLVTSVKTSSEEGRRRFRENGDVLEMTRSQFKETVHAPGERARVTAAGNYANVKLNTAETGKAK